MKQKQYLSQPKPNLTHTDYNVSSIFIFLVEYMYFKVTATVCT